MVGVPGRSKACQTCKQRHIACDLQHLTRDACGPCTRSKRVCSFPKNHIFVNHDESTHKTVYRKTDGERDRASRQRLLQWKVDVRNGRQVSLQPSTASGNATPLPSDSLPQTIHATTLVKQPFLANARNAISNSRNDDSGFPQFWSSAITTQPLDSCACRTSPALACYTAWVGRQVEDPRLVDASRRLYVQGLKEVQQSVNDPKAALRDETLSACIGLIIYEALECPDRSYAAYHKHIEGCTALIKLRGIEAHRDGAGHELFRGFRYIAVIKALQDHRPTDLASPAWSEIPFSIHPKDIHDRLLDILAVGADQLGQGDRLASTPPDQLVPALLDMDDRLRAMDSAMEAIYADLQLQHRGQPLFWPTNPSLSPLDEPQADHPLAFPSQETARLLTLYWSLQTLLRLGRSEILAILASLSITPHPTRLTHALTHPPGPLIEPAHLVLRARAYCLRTQSSTLRFSVPLNITLDVLANKAEWYAEEIRVAKEVKRGISERFLRITRFTGTLKNVKEV